MALLCGNSLSPDSAAHMNLDVKLLTSYYPPPTATNCQLLLRRDKTCRAHSPMFQKTLNVMFLCGHLGNHRYYEVISAMPIFCPEDSMLEHSSYLLSHKFLLLPLFCDDP